MKRIICVILSAAFLLCGCTEKSSGRDLFAMDTFMTLKAYGKNSEKAVDLSVQKIHELENLFSVNISGSDIYNINNSHGNSVEVSQDTFDIINSAVDICGKTDGCLDITIYPVLKEWGFTSSEYKVPDSETLENLLEKVDYTKISAYENTVSIPDGTEIDLGSVAKGYTSRCIYDIMKKNSVDSAIINLGGNVRAVGTKPDGSAWNVGIENPFSQDKSICVLSIIDEAVITSGNYERFFIDEKGNKYWHILDTKNGYPADNGFVSVTVIGSDDFMCDALSTALFVMGKDKAYDYYRRNDGFEAVFVTNDSEIIITEGISDRIKFNDGFEYSVINRGE